MASSSNITPLSFEWDDSNKIKNWNKHRVDYKECEEIFSNRPLKTYLDIKHSQGENRFVALGITNSHRTLYIVFTMRKDRIRIISARNMSRKERNLYESK